MEENGEDKCLSRLVNGIDLGVVADKGSVFEIMPESEFDDTKQMADETKDTFNEDELEGQKNIWTELKKMNFDLEADWNTLKGVMSPVTKDQDIMKIIVKKGPESSVCPGFRSLVRIYYHLLLEGEEESFDSSVIRGEPMEFRLGCQPVLAGLELAVASMKKDETSVFLIDYPYAFGALGCPPRIPPKATIMAYIALLDWTPETEADSLLATPKEDRKTKTPDEVLRAAEMEKLNGNKHVKAEKFKEALKLYDKAIKLLQQFSDVFSEVKSSSDKDALLLKLHLNKAHCYLELERGQKAVDAAKAAMKLDKRNVKAMYRLAKAKRLMKDIAGARKLVAKALEIEPRNEDLNREIRELDSQIRVETEADKSIASKMFKSVKKVKPSEDEVKESQFYPELRRFLDTDGLKEIKIPGVFTYEEWMILQKVASALGLKSSMTRKIGSGVEVITVKKPQ